MGNGKMTHTKNPAQQDTIKTRKPYTGTTSKNELNLNWFREFIYLYSKMPLQKTHRDHVNMFLITKVPYKSIVN